VVSGVPYRFRSGGKDDMMVRCAERCVHSVRNDDDMCRPPTLSLANDTLNEILTSTHDRSTVEYHLYVHSSRRLFSD